MSAGVVIAVSLILRTAARSNATITARVDGAMAAVAGFGLALRQGSSIG